MLGSTAFFVGTADHPGMCIEHFGVARQGIEPCFDHPDLGRKGIYQYNIPVINSVDTLLLASIPYRAQP